MFILPVYFAERCLSDPKINEIQQTNNINQTKSKSKIKIRNAKFK